MFRLRMLLLAALISASAGIITGLGFAAKEIRAQQYLAHGLWRTALWLASRDSMLGVAAGAIAGALLFLSLLPLRTSPSARPPADPHPVPGRIRDWRLLLILLFTAAASLALILVPVTAAGILGIPYWLAVGALLLLIGLIARSAAVPDDLAARRPGAWLEVVWPLAVLLAYLVGLAHLWARAQPEWWAVALSAAGLLVALAIYSYLLGPVQRLLARLSGIAALSNRLPHPRWLFLTILACAIALWTTAYAVTTGARARARAGGLNVIIIAVDTLREDGPSWLAADQREHDLTPNLRTLLAPRGALFSQAYSQAPWTLPAFASILTGLYPEQHGADLKLHTLAPHQLTLAELLREAGYLTAAVVSGPYVSSDVGMMQGFTLRDEFQVPGGTTITSQQVTDSALAFLASHRDEPFFLFAHYFDPHYIYQDHPEFDIISLGGEILPPGNARSFLARGHAEFAKARPLYDEEIAFTDLHIARLLSFLDQHDLWASTCVVFVSDHGDEFLEHGSAGHGHTLFQELIHVPLFVADPSRNAPSTIDDPVETRWLFPTILDALGLPRPDSAASAHTLFDRPEHADHRVRSSVQLTAEGDLDLSCLIGRQYKLIRRHGGRVLLYDLLSDPGETRDLSAERPDETGEYLAALDALDAQLSALRQTAPAPRLTDRHRRQLKDLGYL